MMTRHPRTRTATLTRLRDSLRVTLQPIPYGAAK